MGKEYTKKEGLDCLGLIIKENNFKLLSRKEYQKKGYCPSYNWYANNFGSFINALNEIGYYATYKTLIHKDDAIKILKEEYYKNNKKLSFNNMKKCNKILTPHIYYKIFDTKSWNEVLEKCGLSQAVITFTKEQEDFIKNNYKHMRDEKISQILDINVEKITQKRIRMGLNIPKHLMNHKKSKWNNYSDEYLLNKLHEFISTYNKMPEKNDTNLLKEIGAPSISVYQRRFNKGIKTILGDLGYGYEGTLFTEQDEKFIKENYRQMTDLEIANHLGRTESAIKTKRQLLGCFLTDRKTYKFTEDEVDKIKEMFNAGVELKDIANRFNTTENALIYRYEKFGFKNRINPWTKSEIKILKQIYSFSEWDVILKKLPNRNKDSIIHKAYELGIKKENYFWTEEEVALATDMYLNNCSYKEIKEALGGKFTEGSIVTKIYNLGIMKSNKWTDDELNILIEYYEENPEYVYKNINRDITNIQQKALKMGLKHPSFWTVEEDEYIKNNYKTKTDYEMGEYLNRTRRSVKWRRNKLGLESYFYNHFGNNYIAKDGSVCLSNDELYIHNYLLTTDLHIQKEVYYKNMISYDKTARRFDWVIYDSNGYIWLVEYFGMYDMKRKENKARLVYKENTRKKIKDLYKAGVIDKCIFIFPYDLKNRTLDEIFGKYIDLEDNNKQKIS